MNHANQTGELFSSETPSRARLAWASRRVALLCLVAMLWWISRVGDAAPPSDKSNLGDKSKKTPETKSQASQPKSTDKDKSKPEDESAVSDDDDKASDKEAREAPENPFPRRIKAPDLDGGAGWLNAAGEISLKD